MLTYYICVCLLSVCLPLQGGARGPRGRRVRRWVVVLGPHLPGSSLCSRNLSFSLLRQWGEHVRLWHMVARVTCSLCLALNFWPLEQNLPTHMTPMLLHLPPCSLSTLRSVPPFILHFPVLSQISCVWQVCALRGATPYFGYRSSWLMIIWAKRSPTEFLRFCMFVCLLSVSPDKRSAGPPPSDLHPSAVVYRWTPSTSQANLTFKSPTHIYWTAVLSPV